MSARGVRYLSFPPDSGLGRAAEDNITALRCLGVPVSWTPLAWGVGAWGRGQTLAPFAGGDTLGPFTGRSFGPWRHDDICNLPIECDTLIVHCPPLWYQGWSESAQVERLVAYATHETDRLTTDWVSILNRYELVLVPSTLNLEVFESSGVKAPIRVVPHICRPAPAVHSSRLGSLDDDLFVFYVINTWTARKAIPETITAFLDAFTGDDPVALVVKTTTDDHMALERVWSGKAGGTSPHYGTAWWSLAKLLRGRGNPPRVHLVTGFSPRQEVDALHTRGDCFVSLARGEGWGLGAFEACAYGNPVIVTGWGGHLDFLPPDYPYLINYEFEHAVETEPDDWFRPGPDERWARPDVGHASELLRYVYEHQDEARGWGKKSQLRVTQEFAQERVGRKLIQALDECHATQAQAELGPSHKDPASTSSSEATRSSASGRVHTT